MKNFYINSRRLGCLSTLIFLSFFQPTTQAQITFTANDSVLSYNKVFRFGVNMGYYPGWTTEQLGNLAAGNPAIGVKGIGATTTRPGLYEEILETYGYDALIPVYDSLYKLGLRDMNVFVGGPSGAHRDYNSYCSSNPNIKSALFSNLYEPIWDGGANGTPVNENNYYALYLWKTVNKYKKYARVWEILNEPDFDFAGQQWQGDYFPNFGWWSSNPNPCDYQLRAPIFHYVRMLRISWEVIKTADPTAFVEIGALGYPHFLDAVMRNTDNPVDGSVTPQYPLRGGAFFDVLGYHTYPHIDGSLWTYQPSNGTVSGYHRHSDGAIDSGLVKKQVIFQRVLDKYGYNGTLYPRKQWTITEFNLPRRAFETRYIGNDVIQRNSVVKAAVTSYKLNVMQLHVYNLSDEKSEGEANYEFNLMGFYKKFTLGTPLANLEKNAISIAYKTASDALSGSVYDAERTAAMNLPATIGGGAFRFPSNRYIYVLWAKTRTDYSEDAFANYTFPTAWGISNLEKREWFFSQTNSGSTVSATNVALTASPIFLATAFPIPVELVNFSGKRVNQTSQLSWQTAMELNTQNFEIERSDDGQNFTTIGQVKAKGNTTTPQYYTFSDAQNINNVVYYRLKINDLDGKSAHSKTIALADKSTDKSIVFPNPCTKKLTIQLNNADGFKQDFDLTLTDVSGRVVASQKAQTTAEWSLDNLPSGIYFLKISSKNSFEVHKVVKN